MKVKEFSVKKVSISDIKFDETNPNVVSKDQMDALGKGIKKFGNLSPVILNEDMQILDGEHRVRIYEKMGEQSIPAYVVNVNKIDGKMLRQVMNKLRGEHDKNKDAEEFKALFDAGKLDLFSKLMAKPKEEFEQVLEKKFNMEFESSTLDDIPLPPTKPKSKKGAIYQLGKHKIVCGDATKDIDKIIEKKPQLLFTDPPYGISIVSKLAEGKQDGVIGRSAKMGFVAHTEEKSTFNGIVHRRKYKQIVGDDKPFSPEFLLNLAKTVILFGANHYTDKLPVSSHWLVWDKKEGAGHDHNTFSDVELMWTNLTNRKSAKIYRHLWSGLLRAGDRKTELKDRIHPTQKPVKMLAEIIKDYSLEDEVVLDPYLGSGSTLIACEITKRVCYGVEIDPEYVDAIILRWENFTGKKAKKIGG